MLSRRSACLAAAALLLVVPPLARPVDAQPASSQRYDDAFRKYSKRYFGVAFDWRLFKAQGITESNLNPEAISRAGARGIMQLVPSTWREVVSKNPELTSIGHPEWNIAAGIYYNRRLWTQWSSDSVDTHRRQFMLGSYNAGRATLLRAQRVAEANRLDPRTWTSIAVVAPDVPRWRYQETLNYLSRIFVTLDRMDSAGRLLARPR